LACALAVPEPGASEAVVHLSGDLDSASREALRATIESAMALDTPSVVIDLREVGFLSSRAVRVILEAAAALQGQGRSLVLRAPSPRLQRVIDICGLIGLLDAAKSDVVGSATRAAERGHEEDVPVHGPADRRDPFVLQDPSVLLAGQRL
jgi:anti-sigma B factor antagonist